MDKKMDYHKLNLVLEKGRKDKESFLEKNGFFALTNKEFEDGKEKLKVKNDNEIIHIGNGGFIRKRDLEKYKKIIRNKNSRLYKEAERDVIFARTLVNWIAEDLEYSVTNDIYEVIDALLIDIDDLAKHPNIYRALKEIAPEWEKI